MFYNTFILISLILALISQGIFCDSDEDPINPEYPDVPRDQHILSHWKGGLTSTSFQIKIFPKDELLEDDDLHTYFVLYKVTDLQPQSSILVISIQKLEFPENIYGNVITVDLSGLGPSTQYHYCMVTREQASLTNGQFGLIYYNEVVPEYIKQYQFKTLDWELEPQSFSFIASCGMRTGSDAEVYRKIAEQKVDLFFLLGDFFTGGIHEPDPDLYLERYIAQISTEEQQVLYESTPIAYMWGDYDYGTEKGVGNVPTRDTATKVYKQLVPAHPLKNDLPYGYDHKTQIPVAEYEEDYNKNEGLGIFRSFIVGRCLFIMIDAQSFRGDEELAKEGLEQDPWLKNQLSFASNSPDIHVVFIMIAEVLLTDKEGYFGSNAETVEYVTDLFKTLIIDEGKQLFWVGGGAHMLALDDGSNNEWGFPVIQAGALDGNPNCRGGPYSHGVSTGSAQYVKFNVSDNGDDDICIHVSLMRRNDEVISYNTCEESEYKTEINYDCDAFFKEDLISDVGLVIGFILLTVFILVLVYLADKTIKKWCPNGPHQTKARNYEQVSRESNTEREMQARS